MNYSVITLLHKIFTENLFAGTRQRLWRASARLLVLGGLLLGVLAVTGASPVAGPISKTIGRRPIGVGLTPTLGTYPATSLPLSTDTTVTPNAAPDSATSMSVFTSTNFKGTLEGNPLTGVVRVTDAHPAGTYTVTVKTFASGGNSASTTFPLTVTTAPACDALTFGAATNFATGSNPFSVAVGDFNGDGKQDLAVGNAISDTVSIFLGDGAGSFSAATDFGTDTTPFSVAVGDFNGDGRQDLALPNYHSNNVSILLGNGAGSFSAATNFGAGTAPSSVAVGDFNGDDKQDLAVANFDSSNVSILLGNGAGSFTAATNFGAGTGPVAVAVGDFNGDDKQDLAVANFDSSNVSILLGDGVGSFSAATDFVTGTSPSSVAAGDFNDDGKQDLAVANFHSNNVSIFLGNGAGSFSAATNFGAGNGPRPVAVGDFNGDGKQDLAVANQFSNNLSILLGDGAGNFSAVASFGTGTGPVAVAVGDFNGDAKQDLAVVNQNSHNVSILLRVCVNNAPLLDASKSPMLNDQTQNDGVPAGMVGTPVSSLVDFATPPGQVDNVTDPDSGALLGIALTAADTSGGIWFYSVDNGTTWNPLGAVTDSSARLLAAANSRLYFQPNPNTSGTYPTAITFRAWDQTSGTNGSLDNTSPNGGTTAFSTASDTASLTVNATNTCIVCHKARHLAYHATAWNI